MSRVMFSPLRALAAATVAGALVTLAVPAHAQLVSERYLRQLGARRERAIQNALAQICMQDRNRLPGRREIDPLQARNERRRARHASS